MTSTKQKIVVFDLDETIGHFYLIRLLWDSVHHFIEYNNIPYMMDQKDFNKLIEIYPEVLRPNIFPILNFLKQEKEMNICNGVMIYTNNKYPKEWVYLIIGYIEEELKYKIFDNIVLAFKLDGKTQELSRTSKDKKLSDFVSCCKLPENIEICYFDNTVFPEMLEDNVYYLKVRPYYYHYTKDTIINRITATKFLKRVLCIKQSHNIGIFVNYLIKYLIKQNYTFKEKSYIDYEMDKVISKRIRTHLDTFFGIQYSLPIVINLPQNHKKTKKNRNVF
jgi:hypothetical protein